MSSIKRLTCMVLLTIAVVLATATVSYANSFDIGKTEWDDGEAGHVYGMWDGCDEKTNYWIVLCKKGHKYYTTDKKGKRTIKDKSGEKTIQESVCKWREVTSNRVDFGPEMAVNKSGEYYFIVLPKKLYPTKDYLPQDPVSESDKSERYTLSSEDATALSKAVSTATKEALDSVTYTPGWVNGMGGIWMYAGPDGKLYKNQWVEDNGKKYYIGSDYYMTIGWAAISGKYYYFGKDGALLVNTTTPDGYRVDTEGVWVQNGKQVSSSEYKKYNKSSLSLKIIEDVDSRGTVKSITIPEGKEYTITNLRYSMDPSQWIVGNAVVIFLDVNANPEYSFENNIKITCSQGSIISNKGNNKTRNLEIKYYPKIKLESPEVVIDSDGYLRWNKIERAQKYALKIKSDEYSQTLEVKSSSPAVKIIIDPATDKLKIESEREEVSGNTGYIRVDVNELVNESPVSGMATAINITAKSGSNKYIQESDPYVIEDLGEYFHEHSSEGRFKKSGLNLYYIIGDNEKAYGWIQEGGFWYYFDESKKGRAIKNAWFQDPESGKWYYFDNDGHMLVNTTTPDGYTVGPDGACQ